MAREWTGLFPSTNVDGVEIDGELSALGRRYFGMGGARLHVHTEDARPFLRRATARWDVISIDAYRQPYVPFYLATREFFSLVRSRLATGGVVVVNVGHPAGHNELERTLTATMRTAFPHVLRDPSEPTNTALVGSTAPLSAARLRARAATLPKALWPVALAAAARMGPPLRGGGVFTDDSAPVEWLIDRSIISYAAGKR
jgi:spermidine synthase